MTGQIEVIAAVAVFIITYGLIISEKMHRALAALCGAVLLVILGVYGQEEAVAHIDFNTLGLLVGMMLVVGITRHSGLFEYLAVFSVRIARGKPFILLLLLSTATALLSAFLDNVTTILLLVPITISVAEDLELPPHPFLFSEIIASNIGGTATLIGDPPNIMIGSATGLTFMDFLKNLGPVVLVIFLATVLCFWLLWGRRMRVDRERRLKAMSLEPETQIRDWRLLRQSLLVLGLIVLAFLLQGPLHLESATIALGGAALLLVVTRTDPEEALLTVEWPTILFFLGLFVMVGALERVGVIAALAGATLQVTGNDPAATASAILWLSALASSFLDNIPFTAAMIPLIRDVGTMTGMSLQPLWWVLALGACLGGSGTLIGASANIAAAGIAERNGCPFTFMQYTRVAFPLMLLSILISHAYLYFCWLR